MFNTFFYNPIYNLVVFLLNYISDAGFVIIIATLIIKFILFPFYKKQIKAQIATKKAKPEMDAIKKKYGKSPEDKQKMMMETMAIYKKYDIKPFASIFILAIQMPIIIALYWVFAKGGLPQINSNILYSFVSVPKDISMFFLGIIDLTKTNIVLAAIAGLSQYAYSHITMKDVSFKDPFKETESNNKKKDFKKTLKDDMSKSFKSSLKYGMPVFIFILLSTVLNSVVAIYWITSNLFQVMQEYLVRNEKEEMKNV